MRVSVLARGNLHRSFANLLTMLENGVSGIHVPNSHFMAHGNILPCCQRNNFIFMQNQAVQFVSGLDPLNHRYGNRVFPIVQNNLNVVRPTGPIGIRLLNDIS